MIAKLTGRQSRALRAQVGMMALGTISASTGALGLLGLGALCEPPLLRTVRSWVMWNSGQGVSGRQGLFVSCLFAVPEPWL